MKKIYTSFVLLLTVSLFTQLYAQPTLYQNDLAPVIGESLEVKIANSSGVDPGNGGANQTWDFSNVTVQSTQMITVVPPSSTPYASNFPNADIALQTNGNYDYFLIDNTQQTRVGAYLVGSGTVVPYSDPQLIVKFPVVYNDTYADSFSGNFTITTVNFQRDGKVESTVDGYGTIITPEGTYTDVIRVVSIENYRDVSTWGNIDYYTENYAWYRKDSHYPIFRHSDIYSNGNLTPTTIFLAQSSIGIRDLEFSGISMDIFPNPATESTDIVFNLAEQSEIRISIVNMLGQVVIHASETIAAGKYSHQVDVSSLSAGMYIVKAEIGSNMITQKLQVQ